MSDIEKKIIDNMGLVYSQLHKFNLAYNEEAKSYAVEALWKAIETFDASKNFAFSTYATSCIYNGIMMYFRAAEKQTRMETVSIDEELNEEGFTLEDVLVGTCTIESEQISTIYVAIRNVVGKTKSDLHKRIICAWVNSNFEANQKDIAKDQGTTQAQVSRVLSAFKNKLKKELEVLL